jgi:hypothetical protein
MRAIWAALGVAILTSGKGAGMEIPQDFPRFHVPGHEKEMESLRGLFWLHYTGAGPKATLWDEWLSGPGLWPAVETDGYAERMRRDWSNVLSSRTIDPEGYVATHQHASIAHQLGWPFPFWNQGKGGAGWHFSFKNTIGPGWRQEHLSTIEGWKLEGTEDQGIGEDGWNLKVIAARAIITPPAQPIDPFNSPFIQLRWRASGLADAQPFLEWTTKDNPRFGPDRRMYFDPIEGDSIAYTMIPVFKHPKWTGEITNLRVNLNNSKPEGAVTIQALFTQYDTRHNINSQNFVRGCATYFAYTRDLDFLRRNIDRMRTAIRYMMTEHQTLKRKVVFTSWVGHDGRSGIKRNPDGTKEILSGHGIGNNYWDLLPFGHLDVYATIHYYDALHFMAEVEQQILAHPEWDIPGGALRLDPDMLVKHAAEVKAAGNKLFWNSKTGRFAPIDADGKMHDYGLTFLNFEAVYYDFANPEHAKSVMSWLCGERKVEGDTAQGPEIYHWRFAPRATTRRNVDYYFWAWSSPESIAWGGQVQDGGAVLGFSYHDLMARLRTRGPDDAWARLKEIIAWFDEVQAAGGYRKYYDGSREGTLQGGGTAGGLGLDKEFFESVLVPQVMLNGFLGFKPTPDGFRLNPLLPKDWPELSIDRIHWHDLVLRVRATKDIVEINSEGHTDEPCFVCVPGDDWQGVYLDAQGRALGPIDRRADGAFQVDWMRAPGVRFEKTL